MIVDKCAVEKIHRLSGFPKASKITTQELNALPKQRCFPNITVSALNEKTLCSSQRTGSGSY